MLASVRYFSRAWIRGYSKRLIITFIAFVATIGSGALATETPWHWLIAITMVLFLVALFSFFGIIGWFFRPLTRPPADEVPDRAYAARMRRLEEDLLGPSNGPTRFARDDRSTPAATSGDPAPVKARKAAAHRHESQ